VSILRSLGSMWTAGEEEDGDEEEEEAEAAREEAG